MSEKVVDYKLNIAPYAAVKQFSNLLLAEVTEAAFLMSNKLVIDEIVTLAGGSGAVSKHLTLQEEMLNLNPVVAD